ncbi:wall-associated receptor kinase 3-like [Papaver somniferum]|uniref:wall-associated receptor kinase 3-like n=1 Tax=Papaver somniferum TaxID=3469 RepID=UPI000E70327C|nr:wall-associated receptor kinase 3-like [Papaver somniferum]
MQNAATLPFLTRLNGCSLTGVESLPSNITCDITYDPPKSFIRVGRNNTAGLDRSVEVISMSETEVHVKNWPATRCYQYETGELTIDDSIGWMNFSGTPFTVSYTKNKYFGLGCDTLAYIREPILNFETDCSTTCKTAAYIIDGSCSGSGCCQTKLPKGVKMFVGVVRLLNTSSEPLSFDPCIYSFIGESEKYTLSASDLKGTSFHNKAKDVPVVLDWAVGTKTCEEAEQDMSSFACQKNSTCSNSDKVRGYLCTCNEGFEGNSYLSPGCQGIE